MSMNLSGLGLELDNVRRARRAAAASDNDEPTLCRPLAGQSDTDADTDSAQRSSPSSSPDTSPHLPLSRFEADTSEREQEPLPLCLLCFSRPPSAVLLPCAHLNLCYLCAPLLMHKAAPPSVSSTSPSLDRDASPDPRRDGRVPFNEALSRAMASRSPTRPRRRSLNMGYMAPAAREGRRGGELGGEHVLPGPHSEVDTGLARERAHDGQVSLQLTGESAAQCLICRAGVSGWLRVYTG